jgi:histidyl-tRNA synthetase
VATAGEAGQRGGLPLAQRLREAGIATAVGIPGRSLKAQLRAANDSGARLALVLGDDEVQAGVVKVRDLQTHVEIAVPQDEVVAYVAAHLAS